MEEKTSEGKSRRVRKDAVVCAQAVVGKKKFLVQLEYVHNRDMVSCFIMPVCSREDFYHEVNEPTSDIPKKKTIC